MIRLLLLSRAKNVFEVADNLHSWLVAESSIDSIYQHFKPINKTKEAWFNWKIRAVESIWAWIK